MKKIVALTVLLSVTTPTFCMKRFINDLWETCKDMSNEMSGDRRHPENKSDIDRGCNAMKDLVKFVSKLPEAIYEFKKQENDDYIERLIEPLIKNNKKPPYTSDSYKYKNRYRGGHW